MVCLTCFELQSWMLLSISFFLEERLIQTSFKYASKSPKQTNNQQRINKKFCSLENNGWNTEYLQEIRSCLTLQKVMKPSKTRMRSQNIWTHARKYTTRPSLISI